MMLALTLIGVICLTLAAMYIGAHAAVDWATRSRTLRAPDTCSCGMTTIDDEDIVAWRIGGERHTRNQCSFNER